MGILRGIRKHLLSVVAVSFITATVVAATPVAAINYQAEIKKLQAQNEANAANRSALQNTAQTLEQKIAGLQATITSLDTQIQDNEVRSSQLAAQIAQTNQDIIKAQADLGQLLRQLYIEGDISMIEKVASSKNMSDYVEKEQYGLEIQAKIQQNLARISKLQKEQEEQKIVVEKLLADTKTMQVQVSADKAEVARLLALNQEQQVAYTQTIASTETQISDLQRQQAEENLRFEREQARLAAEARKKAAANPTSAAAAAAAPAPALAAGVRPVDGRAYPWANAPFPNEIVDNWGMYQRQCVSYTAWKVAASGRSMPNWGGRGNAKQWDDNARAAGIPVDSSPRPGDVGVRNAGTYGHVVYVDSVNGDGSINISQYNAAWTGTYSEARIFPGDLVFIHFP